MRVARWLGLVALAFLGGCGPSQPNSCVPEGSSMAAIQASPRPELQAEILAMALSGSVAASDSDYITIVRDLDAIRSVRTDLAEIHATPPRTTTSIFIRAESKSDAGDLTSGRVKSWTCLDKLYGPAHITHIDDMSFVVELPHVLHPLQLAQRYGKVSGVAGAEPMEAAGDGPTICIRSAETTRSYLFDRASGDCPSGCTTHELHLVEVSDAGMVSAATTDTRWRTVDDAPGFACPRRELIGVDQ